MDLPSVPNIPAPLPDLGLNEEKLFSKKNIITFLTIGIILLVIPVGMKFLQQQQILKSRAQEQVITFVPGPYLICDDQGQNCVTTLNSVQVDLRSPADMGPPAQAIPPTVTPTPGPGTPTVTPRPGTPTPGQSVACYSPCTEADSKPDSNGRRIRSKDGYECGNEWCSISKTCPTPPADLKWHNPNCATCNDCSSGE